MAGKALIVYNTCGLHGRDNTRMYMTGLAGIRMQRDIDVTVVWSDCCTSDMFRRSVYSVVKDVQVSFVDQPLPLPITANLAVKRAIKVYGEFDAYFYIEAGVMLHEVPTLLSEMMDFMTRHPETGIVNGLVDYDNALPEYAPDLNSPMEYIVVPHDKALNLHVVGFSKAYVQAWDNCILPDVFFNNGSEATFWMMNASLRKNWMAYLPTRAKHVGGGDGPNLANPSYPPHIPKSGGRLFVDIYRDGKDFGFGWDMLVGFIGLKKDMSHYDEQGFCKNDALYPFLKQNLFIGFDYEAVPGMFGSMPA